MRLFGLARGPGRTVVALVVAFFFAVLPGNLAAQEDARALFQRGQAAYNQGDYESAIRSWEGAYRLEQRPGLQWNLAQAYERLGRLPEAITSLEYYIEHASPDDPSLPDGRARLVALRERLAHTGVRLIGGVDGATVLVDGQDRGRLPRPDPIQLTPGSHEVVVRAPGHSEFTSTVSIAAGQFAEVRVTLRPSGASAPAVASSGDSFPVGPVVLMAAGGAAIVTGVVIGVVALGDAGNAPSRTSPQADSARTLALVADITMGVGIAAAAAGVVWLAVSSGDSASETATAVLPWATTEGGGVVVTGRF